jgi:hypothetical protein
VDDVVREPGQTPQRFRPVKIGNDGDGTEAT